MTEQERFDHGVGPAPRTYIIDWTPDVADLSAADAVEANTCGDPACPGASAHAPDQVYFHLPHDPARQAEMLALNVGGH